MFVACGAGYRCTRTTSLEVSRDGYREMCSPEGDATKFCPAVAAGATSSPAQVVQAGYYSVGGRASCSTCGSEQFIDSDGMCRGCRRCFLTQYDAGGCDGGCWKRVSGPGGSSSNLPPKLAVVPS